MISLFLQFSLPSELLLGLVVLTSALAPIKPSTLLNSIILYLAFPSLLLNSHSAWQSPELHAASSLKSLLLKPNRATSIPTSPFHST